MTNKASQTRRPLDIILGLLLLIVGLLRVYEYYNGAEFNTFRIVVTIFLLVLGVFHMYKYFKK